MLAVSVSELLFVLEFNPVDVEELNMLSISASMLCESDEELTLDVALVEPLELAAPLPESVGGGGMTPPFSAIMLSRSLLSPAVSSLSLTTPSPSVSRLDSCEDDTPSSEAESEPSPSASFMFKMVSAIRESISSSKLVNVLDALLSSALALLVVEVPPELALTAISADSPLPESLNNC